MVEGTQVIELWFPIPNKMLKKQQIVKRNHSGNQEVKDTLSFQKKDSGTLTQPSYHGQNTHTGTHAHINTTFRINTSNNKKDEWVSDTTFRLLIITLEFGKKWTKKK